MGARITSVRPLVGILYFDFLREKASPQSTWPLRFSLGIESTWHLRSGNGEHIGSAQASEGTAVEFAAKLEGEVVRELTILSSRAMVLRLERGDEVEVLDDSDQYESFCIPELAIYV